MTTTCVAAACAQLDHCCGVAEIGGFHLSNSAQMHGGYYGKLTNVIDRNNTYVYKIATFIDSPQCKQAYKIMCDKLKLVSQTEPKRNPNSGNKVFVAVFTNKDRK